MTREEVIKYHEESLECLSNMENNNCIFECENCHINTGINGIEVIRETIRYLKENS